MPFPKYVPHLTASNIYSGTFTNHHKVDCHCASRWLHLLFITNTPAWNKAVDILTDLLAEDETFYAPKRVGIMSAIILWNEYHSKDKDYIASTLNRVFRRLGYTEYEYVDVPFSLD